MFRAVIATPSLRKYRKVKDLPVRLSEASMMMMTLLAAPSTVRFPAIVEPAARVSYAY